MAARSELDGLQILLGGYEREATEEDALRSARTIAQLFLISERNVLTPEDSSPAVNAASVLVTWFKTRKDIALTQEETKRLQIAREKLHDASITDEERVSQMSVESLLDLEVGARNTRTVLNAIHKRFPQAPQRPL